MHDPLTLELASGQITLAAPVEERNGQTVMMELAPDPEPAPLTFARDATEQAAREQRDALRRAAEKRAEELRDDDARKRARRADRGPAVRETPGDEPTDHRTAAQIDRDARGVVLFNGEEITREAYDRIRGVKPAELEEPPPAPRFTVESPRGVRTVDGLADGDTWSPRGETHAELVERVKTPRKRGAPFTCARCDRELEPEQYVYSRHTGARYCLPGEGCNHNPKGA